MTRDSLGAGVGSKTIPCRTASMNCEQISRRELGQFLPSNRQDIATC
jgi:hypothetical protein